MLAEKRLWLLLGALGGASFATGALADSQCATAAEDAAYLVSHTKSGVPYRLNLAQKNQYCTLMHSLAGAGQTPTAAPSLFRAVALSVKQAAAAAATAGGSAPQAVAASPISAPQDLNTIIAFDETNLTTPTYAATALSSVVNGTKLTTIDISITDPTGTTTYATNTQSQYSQGTDFLVSVAATNVPSNIVPIAVATISYTPNLSTDNNPIYLRSELMQPANIGCMTAPNKCTSYSPGTNTCLQYQTACTNTGAPTLPAINVCYQRGAVGTCDYYNNSGRPPTNFLLPSAGSVNFTNQVVSPASGTWTAQVQDTINGGTCILSQDAPMDSRWTPTGSSVGWNLPQMSLNSPTPCLNLTGGQSLNFILTGNVALTGTGVNGKGTFTFSSNSPTGRGIFIVPQVYLEDSCLAAGTRVSLANGTSKDVEKISADNHDVVRTGRAEAREVLGTSSGTEAFPMYRIATSRGQNLLATRTHPIMTPNGAVMARDLKVGATVVTNEGNATITALTQETYTGRVYNLRLGQIEDAQAGKSTFFANGILVGDLKTQTYYEKLAIAARVRDPNLARERLAKDYPEWLADFDNHVKFMKQQQQQR